MGHYLDFGAHPFAHRALFEQVQAITQVPPLLEPYAEAWLEEAFSSGLGDAERVGAPEGSLVHGRVEVYAEPGATFRPATLVGPTDGRVGRVFVGRGSLVLGAHLYVEEGDLWIGPENRIEPAVGLKGPTILGRGNDVRQGAYFRGRVVIGDGGRYRCELKNVVCCDGVTLPHISYAGDSIFGYKAHFGNGATAANVSLLQRRPFRLTLDGEVYETSVDKLGIVLGDEAELGCNAVAYPGTLVGPGTKVYALTPLRNGVHAGGQVIKFGPGKHGLVESVPLRAHGR
ncbi:MAG: hypothetical protein ABIO70_17155 [Pseudomonadota bacterium]